MVCKQPKDFGIFNALAKATKKELFDMGKKDRKLAKVHLRTLEDTTDLFVWYNLVNAKDKKEFETSLTDMAGGMDFHG